MEPDEVLALELGPAGLYDVERRTYSNDKVSTRDGRRSAATQHMALASFACVGRRPKYQLIQFLPTFNNSKVNVDVLRNSISNEILNEKMIVVMIKEASLRIRDVKCLEEDLPAYKL